MRHLLTATAASLALAAVPLPSAVQAQSAETIETAREQRTSATGTFLNAEGAEIGTARLTQLDQGVLIEVDVSDLPEGEHGFHFHQTGVCEAENAFESAGSHYSANGDETHGYLSDQGPHVGDMPNQFVSSDGHLRAHVINPFVTLDNGDGALNDDDGTALLVHSNPDDYFSQPSGEAGDRLACAVVEMD